VSPCKAICYFSSVPHTIYFLYESQKKSQKKENIEFAVNVLFQSIKNDEKSSKDITNASKVKKEAGIVGWTNKRSSKKKMSIAIYDILSENGYPEDKTNKLTTKIIELAKRDPWFVNKTGYSMEQQLHLIV